MNVSTYCTSVTSYPLMTKEETKMLIIITKDGKAIDAFYHTSGKGVVEIDYKNPLASLYLART